MAIDIFNINQITINDNLPDNDDWVEDAFMVSLDKLDPDMLAGQFQNSAMFKFTDTSLGGSIPLNVYPQYTRYADIRYKGKLKNRNEVKINDLSGNIGMGRYYAEAIDDNATHVYFEFGVPEFNNILYYLLSATDYEQSLVANTGSGSIFYTAGKALGTLALFIAFPIITTVLLVGKFALSLGADLLLSPGRFEHYYLKPTMFLYWSTVNTIANAMATELGILSPLFQKSEASTNMVGVPLKVTQDQLDGLKQLMPGIITDQNGINVVASVTKAQKRYTEYIKDVNDRLNNIEKFVAEAYNFTDNLTGQNIYNTDYKSTIDMHINDVVPANLWNKLKKALPNDPLFNTNKRKEMKLKDLIDYLKNKSSGEIKKLFAPNKDGQYTRNLRNVDEPNVVERFFKTMKATIDEGARYAIFRVEHPGSPSESFSNSYTDVSIGETINGLGDRWRDIKFNLGAADIPVVGEAIKAVTQFAAGALSGVTLGLSNVVASFLAGAKIEVPKRWTDSSMSLPTANFKMTLISPSAHPLAQLRNIYIPLAAILAGVLPKATGPRSYTSPFLCSMYVRGYQKISLGMITSVTVTRGVSNLPFNQQRRPLAVDVSFTVTDFSNMITAPISKDLLSAGEIMFDDESGIARYIQSLCSRDLYSTTHVFDRFKLKLSTWLKAMDYIGQPETAGAYIGDKFTWLHAFGGYKGVNYSELF